MSHLLFGTPLRKVDRTRPTSGSGGAFSVKRNVVVNHEEHRFTDDYQICEVVGSGTFGIISVAREHRYGFKRALKANRSLAQQSTVDFAREVAIHSALDHPHILRLYESYEWQGRRYVTMELCRGGNLQDVMEARNRPFAEQQAKNLFEQALKAVKYLHRQHVVHRDLKLDNLLLKEPGPDAPDALVKLIDFGFARRFRREEAHLKTMCGTPAYLAPEVVARQGPYNQKCDLFSAGVVLFKLTHNRLPFAGKTVQEMLHSIMNSPIEFAGEEEDTCSQDAHWLIEHLLEKRPEHRLSAEEALNCRWLNGRPTKHLEKARSRKIAKECLSDMLENCRKFSSRTSFHQVALKTAAYNADDTVLAALREAFLDMDSDGDGKVTREELGEFMSAVSSETFDDKELKCLFEQADLDGNGTLEYTEFLACAMQPREALDQEACIAAFKALDFDCTGQISAGEIRHVIGSLCRNNRRASVEMDLLLNKYDANGDGTLDFEEFERMLRRRTSAFSDTGLTLDCLTGSCGVDRILSAELDRSESTLSPCSPCSPCSTVGDGRESSEL